MRIAVVSALFGAYDPLAPPPPGFDDAVCVTDSAESIPDGWRIVIEPGSDDPRLDSKRAKMQPWRYTDCDAAIFLDASIEVTSPNLRAWVEPQLTFADLVVWSHPEGRACYRDEAAVCWDWPKYARYDLRGQVDAYASDGMPEKWGLFACGMIGWRFTEEARRFGGLWLHEQIAWSCQDQVSLPYLLWREAKPFGIWPANQYQNPHIRIRWDRRPAGQGPSAPQ
jgi:hypothetical protein